MFSKSRSRAGETEASPYASGRGASGLGTLADRFTRELGKRSAFAHASLRSLHEAMPRKPVQEAYSLCVDASGNDPDFELFANKTYFALCAEAVCRTIIGQATPAREGHFWQPILDDAACSPKVFDAIEFKVRELFATHARVECEDLFHELYESLIPRATRHVLGEYYTPAWLVKHVLDAIGLDSQADADAASPDHPQARLLDPTCGSGAFLVAAISRMRQRAGDRPVGSHAPDQLLSAILHSVVGFDQNPLALLAARANYLAAIRDLVCDDSPSSERSAIGRKLPLFPCDVVLEPPNQLGVFDFVVGNPPWIAWDHLPAAYRELTKPIWEKYGLFTLTGTQARHGGGKKDLSMLVLFSAADRWLRMGGRLGFVIPQTVFQTKGAGDGFRRFRLGETGTPLKVLRVDDLVRVKPFAGAANWTSVIVLEKGRPTEYPVAYYVWKSLGNRAAGEATSPAQAATSGEAVIEARVAEPIDSSRGNSPWIIRGSASRRLADICGKSDYVAHLGANSGGANGIFWLHLEESEPGADDTLVRARNLANASKKPVPSLQITIEPDLLYPLLRWSDVGRYRAVSENVILLVQDVASRSGMDEPNLATHWPRTYAYLCQFSERLRERSAFRRYQSRGPFYSMYNVGPYTLSPNKVIWRRMDRRLNAVAVESLWIQRLGARPVIPQETCVLVATESRDESDYLSAIMNSAPANRLVQSHSVYGGKGFGTPSILDYLPVAKYAPAIALHQRLAALGHAAHQAVAAGSPDRDLEQEINRHVGTLWGLSSTDVAIAAEEEES